MKEGKEPLDRCCFLESKYPFIKNVSRSKSLDVFPIESFPFSVCQALEAAEFSFFLFSFFKKKSL